MGSPVTSPAVPLSQDWWPIPVGWGPQAAGKETGRRFGFGHGIFVLDD